jgi:hypothetical protein
MVCCGDTTQQHLSRHSLTDREKCKPLNGESLEYLVTKKLLCKYLNSGGRITLNTDAIIPTLLEWKTDTNRCWWL